MPIRIVYVTIQSVDASLFREPAEEVCGENGWDLDLFCANDSDIDEEPLLYHELTLRTKTADLVLVRVMADPTRMRRFEQWEKVLRECPGYVHVYSGNLEVSLVYRDLFKGDDREYMRLREFVRGRGAENDRAIVQWVHHAVTGEGDVPDPVEHRPNGIYHPDFDRDVTLDEYLAHLDPSKPTIGLMFTANLWIYGNLEHIDAFIRETESQGMNIIPVFFSSVASRTDGNEGSVAIVREYFTEGGRSRVDALVMATPFSQLNNSRDCSGVYTPDWQNYLHTPTDVPVFQAMSVSAHFADYEESAEGLSKGDFGMNVIWPEVDGQIITVPFASNERGRGGPKVYTPLPDRIRRLVSTVGAWARLRHKPASERRIAILMYQSRPDSGRIGGAAGLDTMQSVRDMLERMSSLGYTVDHVPETSRALTDEILDNITNDLEWSSEERVREKAAAMVVGHPVHMTGCGRTDAGVHARVYVANFRTSARIPCDRIPYALNTHLPEDIVVTDAMEVHEDFNAIGSCVKKEYTYLIYNSGIRDPFYVNRAWFYPKHLNEKIMQRAADCFIGTHDFAAVRSVGTDVKSTVRTVYDYKVERDGDLISLRVSANGFLYNMARAMAGTCVYAAEGKFPPEAVAQILLNGDRTAAGPTVPPGGLYMTQLWYDDGRVVFHVG